MPVLRNEFRVFGMEKIRKFEDLIAWQKARELTKAIYQLTSDGLFSKDFGLRDQIRRAVVSVMSNISEGFERGSLNEFHQFLVIAKASCAEVRSQLYVALDAGYINESAFQILNQQAIEVSKIIGGLRASIAKQRP
jgi:four helix bundle protein